MPAQAHARLRRALLAVATASACVGLLPGAPGVDDAQARPGAASAHPTAVIVTVDRSASGRAVPRSFLGLATEYAAIPVYARHAVLFDRVLGLIRPPSGSPLVMRIGGLSADDSLWTPALTASVPAKAVVLTLADLARIGALVRAEHLRVILDLNLAADIPDQEAALAGAAESDLPRGSIAAFEIGNEPDYYRFALRDNPAYYPQTYSPLLYASRFRVYAGALSASAPGVPLAGPALANPVADFRYLSDLVSGDRNMLGMLTVHRYALSACAPPGSALHPTITRLLRPSASVGLADTLAPSVALARSAGVPLRWDELNSVTCGGTLGVSDSFASALWIADTLFAAVQVGVDGVNVQMRPTALNAPFYLTSAGLQPRPLLYGLVLFRRALGSGARLVATRLASGPAANVAAWALRLGSRRLHVVLLNKGTGAQSVLLRLRAGVRRPWPCCARRRSGRDPGSRSPARRSTARGGGPAGAPSPRSHGARAATA